MSKLLLSLTILLSYFQYTQSSLIHIPPEANYDFPQYIQSLSHPYEQHEVTTADGYMLTYFRIQKQFSQIQSGLPVILLHHGLLDSADSFIINDEYQAPALLLANDGFDVWLGNSRGNKYGLGHVDPANFNSSDPDSKFWDFSWQEMSEYDLPAGMQYISEATGQPNITYIGHSQGTSIMIAALARRDPTVIQYLDKFIALAPVAFVQHSTSIVVRIAGDIQSGTFIKEYDDLIKRKKFAWESETTRHMMEDICSLFLELCVVRLRLISDFKTSVDNTQRLVITQGHFPAGTSLQNMMYWQQMFDNGGTFKMYDFGKEENLEVYGSPTPPVYDLSKIVEPVYMFAGEWDELAPLADTQHLRAQLTGSSKVFYQTYKLGHSSFVYGKDVAGYMADVLTILNS